MKEKDLKAAIVKLKAILEDLKALLEWHKLKRFEAAQRSFSNLKFDDTTVNDLNDKYSTFLLLASQIHAGLNNQNIQQSKLEDIKKELIKIQLQAYYLGSDVRVY